VKETLDLCGPLNNEDADTPFVGWPNLGLNPYVVLFFYNSCLFHPNQLVVKLSMETILWNSLIIYSHTCVKHRSIFVDFVDRLGSLAARSKFQP
jgi:hypothetical protein